MTCNDCPLKGRPRVEGFGVPGTFAVVGEAPGREEVRRGRPFVGRAGELLRETLVLAKIDPDQGWFTNACLCHPEGNATPTGKVVRACRERLLAELREIRPLRVLAVGGTALSALFPDLRQGVTTLRGQWLWSEEAKVWVLITIHPAAILYSPSLFPDFANDVRRFSDQDPQSPSLPSLQYTVCESHRDLIELTRGLERHLQSRSLAFTSLDIETTGLEPLNDRLLCIGIGTADDHVWIVLPEVASDPRARTLLKRYLEDPRLNWVGHNGYQFDGAFLLTPRHLGVSIDVPFCFDTLLAHYCLDERQSGHDLKTLAREYCQALDYSLPRGNLEEIPRDDLYRYLSLDCHYTRRLAVTLQQEITREGVKRVHDDLLLPAAKMLRDVELTGILVDTDYLTNVRQTLQNDYQQVLLELRKTAQEVGLSNFNPNSPKQVAELLYDRLRLPDPGGKLIVGMTSGGGSVKSRSTEREVLASFHHPIADKILEARQRSRLESTYVEGILRATQFDGRVRSDFLLFGTVTGRLSSRNPNLQNVPVLLGPMIRDAFVATPEWTLVEADYSQLELRVLAHLSQDPSLIEIYQQGEDLHRQVAAECFKVPLEEVTDRQRYFAKYIDFGIIYGRQAPSLASQIECSVSEAQAYIDRLFARFPGVQKWMRRQHRDAVQVGEICSIFGRKRRFPLITENILPEVQRQAVNAPIQGTASDICLLAAVRLQGSELFPETVRILALVHDELLLEVQTDVLAETLPRIKEIMEHPPFDSPVPLVVDFKTGNRWGSLEKRSIVPMENSVL